MLELVTSRSSAVAVSDLNGFVGPVCLQSISNSADAGLLTQLLLPLHMQLSLPLPPLLPLHMQLSLPLSPLLPLHMQLSLPLPPLLPLHMQLLLPLPPPLSLHTQLLLPLPLQLLLLSLLPITTLARVTALKSGGVLRNGLTKP